MSNESGETKQALTMSATSGGGVPSALTGSSSRQSISDMGDISETESDTSSLMGESMNDQSSIGMKPPSPASREQLSKRIESLLQENLRLKTELEAHKLRVRTLQQENKSLKHASVLIQAKAEQEEEFISNTLLKKIQELKKEKETLALNYEQEEEFLTNDLSRKLYQLRNEKAELAETLQQEQESLVNKLMRKIQKLESETNTKQSNLEQLRREKVELENTLEQEQEALVNRLWKRMDRLEAEKRMLQEKMEQPISAPPSPMDVSVGNGGSSPHPASASAAPSALTRPTRAALDSNADPAQLVKHIQMLRGEVNRLKQQLTSAATQHSEKAAHLARDEQHYREENLRLRRKLELEMERRQELCRHLSESESSLEMEDERHFNELSNFGAIPPPPASAGATAAASGSNVSTASSMGGSTTPQQTSTTANSSTLPRCRTISSPNPIAFPSGRPVSPALGSLNVNVNLSQSAAMFGQVSPAVTAVAHHVRCQHCGSLLPVTSIGSAPSPSPGWSSISSASIAMNTTPTSGPQSLYRTKSGERDQQQQHRVSGCSEKFVRPANPPTPKAASPAPASPKTSSASSYGGSGEPMDQCGKRC
uniref:Coiled-coil domain-containing protein 6 n=1 Tax=Plectus sambesii TaxID=2011161 RepID=A0A914UUY1_9BILA